MVPERSATTRMTAIFTKRPRPGQVKTRLVPPLSPEEASRLAEAMLTDTVRRLCACAEFRTELVFAPAGEGAWFEERFPELAGTRTQRGEGLGERLAAFFEEALGAGGSVVVVGSDQPLLSAADVLGAHRALEEGSELVLTPDGGGGYALVGLVRPVPELFRDVTMSTEDMFEVTCELARRLGVEPTLLEPRLDVDRGADLVELERALAAWSGSRSAPDFPRETCAVLERLKPLSSRER